MGVKMVRTMIQPFFHLACTIFLKVIPQSKLSWNPDLFSLLILTPSMEVTQQP